MENKINLKPVRRAYSGIGWALCAILVTLLAVQIITSVLIQAFWPDGCWLTRSSYGKWIVSFVPQYLIAIPIGLLILRRVPATPPESIPMGGKMFWLFLPICFFLTYAGNFVGNTLSSLLSSGQAENALNEYALDTSPIKILIMVVLAPIIEEYVFRQQIIDRTRVYGEKAAVFFSALAFGLFHTNLFQFFYAFLVGWIFAYIYIRTGRLRYPVIMHSILNFMGAVVAPFILSLLDLEALSSIDPNATEEELMAIYQPMLPGLMLYMLYLFFLVGVFVTGLVFMILQCKKLIWKGTEAQLPRRSLIKGAYINVGIILFLILCTALTILSVLL